MGLSSPESDKSGLVLSDFGDEWGGGGLPRNRTGMGCFCLILRMEGRARLGAGRE